MRIVLGMRRTRNRRATRPGLLARLACRVERRLLGLGMRGVAAFADRRMSRYHARELAAEPPSADEPRPV